MDVLKERFPKLQYFTTAARSTTSQASSNHLDLQHPLSLTAPAAAETAGPGAAEELCDAWPGAADTAREPPLHLPLPQTRMYRPPGCSPAATAGEEKHPAQMANGVT